MFGITKDLIEPRDTNAARWSQDFLDAVLLGRGALAAQRGGWVRAAQVGVARARPGPPRGLLHDLFGD